MRRARRLLALLRPVLLGLVLVAAAHPGSGSPADLGTRWAAAAPSATLRVPAPLLGKRWT
jgi:hypothetical protein